MKRSEINAVIKKFEALLAEYRSTAPEGQDAVYTRHGKAWRRRDAGIARQVPRRR